jgi:hypothetical protein
VGAVNEEVAQDLLIRRPPLTGHTDREPGGRKYRRPRPVNTEPITPVATGKSPATSGSHRLVAERWRRAAMICGKGLLSGPLCGSTFLSRKVETLALPHGLARQKVEPQVEFT